MADGCSTHHSENSYKEDVARVARVSHSLACEPLTTVRIHQKYMSQETLCTMERMIVDESASAKARTLK